MVFKLVAGSANPVYLVDEVGSDVRPISDSNPLPVDIVSLDDGWDLVLLSDTGLNDSDKNFTVPAGYVYQVLWIWVELTSDATAGNRQMSVQLFSSLGQRIGEVRAGVVQAASLTRYYMFAASLADLLAFRDTNYLMTPFPPTILLPANYTIRILDENAIAAGTDDMVVRVMVARKAV